MKSDLSPIATTSTLPESKSHADYVGATLNPPNSRRHSSSHVAGRPLRIALLTNEVPPYRAPFYQELAATSGWDFSVFTCIDREADRQ